MQAFAIELARFRLKSHLTDETFKARIKETTDALSTYPGFVSRQVCKTTDGEYFDIVAWQDLPSAALAASSFGNDARAKLFIDALDFAWVGNWMKHLALVSAKDEA
jgi:hypothetical protein